MEPRRGSGIALGAGCPGPRSLPMRAYCPGKSTASRYCRLPGGGHVGTHGAPVTVNVPRTISLGIAPLPACSASGMFQIGRIQVQGL